MQHTFNLTLRFTVESELDRDALIAQFSAETTKSMETCNEDITSPVGDATIKKIEFIEAI